MYEDVEFSVQDDGTPLGLDTELITITVGNVNRPPEFFVMEPQEVLENELLLFTVEAIDPDGDDIAYSVDPLSLPAGAVFDPTTLTFSWRPDRTQEGNYTVVFFATDNGTPSAATGETAVFITVGDVPTATELVDVLLTTISLLDLDKAVVKSYLANLKKLHTFILRGKLGPAVNQVNAFIGKVEQDIVHGNIDAADGDHLMFIANDLIILLDG